MRRRLLNVGFGVVFMATVVIASGNREPLMPQQSTPDVKNEGASASRKDSIGKTVKDLSEQINDLKSRIRLLEAQQEELRGRLTRLERPQLCADLNGAASELAGFDCEPDFNRAHAMAITQGTPGYTSEGAAAMNCTQRLAKITEKAVRSIENR
jgi:TolA-binding protein